MAAQLDMTAIGLLEISRNWERELDLSGVLYNLNALYMSQRAVANICTILMTTCKIYIRLASEYSHELLAQEGVFEQCTSHYAESPFNSQGCVAAPGHVSDVVEGNRKASTNHVSSPQAPFWCSEGN